jgi:hypothetical protein
VWVTKVGRITALATTFIETDIHLSQYIYHYLTQHQLLEENARVRKVLEVEILPG